MAKYIVKITRTEWYETTINADNEENAWEIAENEAYNGAYNGDSNYWNDLQSSETCVYSVEED